MSKITNGPWRVSEPFNTRAAGEAYTIRHDRRDRTKWNGYVADVLCNSPNAKANADLIAAAPELLDALKSTLSLLKVFTRETDAVAKAVWDAAESAIASAEGAALNHEQR